MGVVVVGGTVKGAGKTTLVCELLTRLSARQWTAIKITQCHHSGADCHCELGGERVAVSEENDRGGAGDTSRYLRAGAERAVWVRLVDGAMEEAVGRLRPYLGGDVVIESNGVLEFLQPDACVFVVGAGERKESAMKFLGRADLVVEPGSMDVGKVAELCESRFGVLG